MMNRVFIGLILCGGALIAADAAPAILWRQNFETVPVDEIPDGSLILEGDFGVQLQEAGRVLRLKPGSHTLPGLLVGPARQAPIEITATGFGAAKKRLAPIFGVGLHGDTGWKLMAAPGRDRLELWFDRKPVAAFEMKFAADTRWRFRLASIATTENKWTLFGKCWPESHMEPEIWQIQHATDQAPNAGRAGLWAATYAGRPVDFDDVTVRTLRPEDAAQSAPDFGNQKPSAN